MNEKPVTRFPDPPTGSIEERMSPAHYRHRLHVQTFHSAQLFSQGTTFVHLENLGWLMRGLKVFLQLTGLLQRGRRNAQSFEIVRREIVLTGLPPAFDGFTFMHLSDLHVDMAEGFIDALADGIAGLEYDCCVITGDFRGHIIGPYQRTVALTKDLLAHIRTPAYAILGNHDFIELVEPLEAAGLRFLLNEHITIERNGARLYLAGVDDAHFYQTDNFHRAADGIPDDAASIILSHSPETYLKGAACGFGFMLCGHTHGGQICLPGRFPIVRNGRCPYRLISGPWRHGLLQGYTSRGAGSSGVPVRFNCPPEITLHTLRRD